MGCIVLSMNSFLSSVPKQKAPANWVLVLQATILVTMEAGKDSIPCTGAVRMYCVSIA